MCCGSRCLPLLLSCLEDMGQLEAKCSDVAVRSSLVAKFSTVEGATLDKRIANTLKTLLNDSLAANLNFCGKGEKRAFKGTRFQLVVNDAVRKAPIFASAGDAALQ
ncbi:hypothetical protein CAPTEDRAFT_210769 [Capitella teleta]|uniref:DUF4806 domain-containing protein n=1 Tax=Capitella teleta TaxID=283909 RepID=R7VJQ9_CAPTE|nr:hypothetical protein CAPTEDRAFT_210769 [Capitella teleta]|eukprot:ELU16681.1 hypothetical protein CAPTEDRAFT_210769 [Capitella teleta]